MWDDWWRIPKSCCFVGICAIIAHIFREGGVHVTQNADTQTLLYRVRLLLDEGRNEEALSTLQDIRAEDVLQKEIVYLNGWCYIQMKQWNLGIQTLMPLLAAADPPPAEAAVLERERLTLCLLYLGLAAMSLTHYEDASLHLTHCLKVLHDRRVHLPVVRIKARFSLAQTCMIRGLYATAVRHFEEALRLCHHYNDSRELLAIYYGLCDACCYTNNYEKAIATGQEALHLCHERNDHHMEERTLQLLGEVCLAQKNYLLATQYYTQSLRLACDHEDMPIALTNYIALIDLCVAEKRLDEARSYCDKALNVLEREEIVDGRLRGETYRVLGKMTQAEALNATGDRWRALLEEAIIWYEKAAQQTTEDGKPPRIAEIYERWAQVLEDLGRHQEALKRWHYAYALLDESLLNVSERGEHAEQFR